MICSRSRRSATTNGESRKRLLYVAIDRCSRWVHLAVRDDELATSAIAFLTEEVRAFPFKITHVLTDRGSCFTADGFEDACRRLKVEHRRTKPYTPQTNGFVERFNGRVQREVLGITISSHRAGSRDHQALAVPMGRTGVAQGLRQGCGERGGGDRRM